MAIYAELPKLLHDVTTANSDEIYPERIVPYLVEVWLDEYARVASTAQIVEVTLDNYSYLFDIATQRLIAAWGVSQGRHDGPRPSSRMKKHPLSDGPRYHRGHAIAHTLGGPADINLVPQLGSVNSGAFQILEQQAVNAPGSLYFTYWGYGRGSDQRPASVDQGLLNPGHPTQITTHPN